MSFFSTHTTLARFVALLLLASAVLVSISPITHTVDVVYAQDNSVQGNGLGDDLNAISTGMQNIPAGEFGCFAGTDPAKWFEGCLSYLGYQFLVFCSWLAAVVGSGLNFVVKWVVVSMGQVVGNLPGVTEAWEVLRDLANVFLVFLTVFIGLATIVGNSKYGAKQLLFRVILAALFVNFSITIAKVIIDVSNVAALEAYQMLLNEHAALQKEAGYGDSTVKGCDVLGLGEGGDPSEDHCVKVGVSGAFASRLGLTALFNEAAIKEQSNSQGDMRMLWVGITGGIMFLVMAFVFGAAAFILLSRFVILLFLIVVSPLAFVMWVTGVSNQGAKWWQTLINQSLVAPALFLMWWVAYKVIGGTQTFIVPDKTGIASGGMQDMGSYALFSYFFLATALLIASLIVAQNLGSKVAGSAMQIGKKWSQRAGGVAFAGTVGWGANKMGEHYTKTRARATRNFNAKLERANQDIASGDPHKQTSGYLRRAGLNALQGVGNVANVAALGQLKTGSALDRSIAGGMGIPGMKVGGAASYREGIAATESRRKDVAKAVAAQDAQSTLRGNPADAEVRSRVTALRQTELEEGKKTLLENLSQAVNLSSAQMDLIMKSDKYTDDEKEKVRVAKYAEAIHALDDSTPGLSEDERNRIVSSLGKKDIENLRGEISKSEKGATRFSGGQFEDFMSSASFTDEEKLAARKKKFEEVYNAHETARSTGNTAPLEQALAHITDKEAELLEQTLLDDELVIQNMSQDLADKLQSSSKIASTTRGNIKTTRQTHFKNLATSGALGAKLKGMKAPNAAKVLGNLSAADMANPTVMAEILKAADPGILMEATKTLKTAERQAIRSEIQTQYTAIKAKQAAGTALSTDETRILNTAKWLRAPTGGAIF